MIARIWRGFTRESDKDTYFEFLKKTGLKDYAATAGNQGVWCLRRVRDGGHQAFRRRRLRKGSLLPRGQELSSGVRTPRSSL